jgi:hypothetical protein
LILSRIMAVLSATCFVAAFTVATLMPPATSLVELVADLDHPSLVWLKQASEAYLPSWVWLDMEVPMLLRPAWLLPTGLGLVLLGFAVTLGSRKRVVGSHRRRS